MSVKSYSKTNSRPAIGSLEQLRDIHAHEFVCTVFVKNLTISLPDTVLYALRLRAKADRKSVTQWLSRLLQLDNAQSCIRTTLTMGRGYEASPFGIHFVSHSDQFQRFVPDVRYDENPKA